jgi:hypothetical protein
MTGADASAVTSDGLTTTIVMSLVGEVKMAVLLATNNPLGQAMTAAGRPELRSIFGALGVEHRGMETEDTA